MNSCVSPQMSQRGQTLLIGVCGWLAFAISAFAQVTSATSDSQEPAGPSQQRPNIVLIIADDLGYGETGMMGNPEIPTPNIDALAASGVRFTAGYVTSSYCSPSRAGIFSGRYQSRFGYDANPTGKRNLLPDAGLPETETTFVQRLADSGYATGLCGKWHLGTSAAKRPTSRGFDTFFGFLHEGHYYVPGPPYNDVATMIRDTSLEKGTIVRQHNLIRGNYAPISEPAYDADNPIMRGDESIVEPDYLTDAITDEAIEFIDDHHSEAFCLVVSYNAVHSPMQAKTEDLRPLRRIHDLQRRVFAGMLVALDRGVGRLQSSLDDHLLTRNTLVVFVSDNGGPTEELTSSNAPLRGGKGSLYEGGIRIPMVWSMPGRLPAGQVEPRPMLSLDIAATALGLAGLPADPQADGRDIFEWIDDPLIEHPHPTIFWRMPGGKHALRMGNWKMVRAKRDTDLELYHLSSDVSESRNLTGQQPEKLNELLNQWLAIDAQMKPADVR